MKELILFLYKRPITTIIFATFLAYFSTLFNGFCLDDTVIFSAPYSKSLADSWQLFTQPVAHRLIDHYRPVSFISFICDYTFWAKNPIGYHFTNILLAALIAVAIFFFIAQLLSREQAFWGALIFTVLPGHSEAVMGIYNRSQLISTLFIVIACVCFLHIRKAKFPALWVVLSSLLVFIGCLAKESTLMTPALACLLYFVVRPDEKHLQVFMRRAILWQIVACVFYMGLRFSVLNSLEMPGATGFLENQPLLAKYFNIARLFTRYIVLAIFPIQLSCDYPLEVVSFHLPALFYPLFFLWLGWLLWKGSYNQRLFSLCGIWFLAALVPVLHFIPLQIPFAERLLHPASLSIAIATALLFPRIKENRLLFSGIVLCMMCMLIHRSFHWRDDTSLWNEALKVYPNSYRAKIYLGSEAARNNDWQKALGYFREALKNNPNINNQVLIYYNMLIAYRHLGLTQQISPTLNKIFELLPEFAPAWSFLGNLAYQNNEWNQVLNYYTHVVEASNKWNLDYGVIYQRLGVASIKLRNWPQAFLYYEQALKLKPEKYDLYVALGDLGLALGKHKEIIHYLPKALKLHSQPYKIHYLLALAYKKSGNQKQFLYHKGQAQKLKPANVVLPQFKD